MRYMMCTEHGYSCVSFSSPSHLFERYDAWTMFAVFRRGPAGIGLFKIIVIIERGVFLICVPCWTKVTRVGVAVLVCRSKFEERR